MLTIKSKDEIEQLPEFLQQEYAFCANIRNPDRYPVPPGIPAKRMSVYQNLLYNNIEDILASGFPVVKSILTETVWHAMVRDFFANHRSVRPFFYEIPQEFLEYLQSERDISGDPLYLLELAHYEWVELALETSPLEIDDSEVNLTGDFYTQAPILSPLVWTLSYRFPVHRISPDFLPTEPGETPTLLIVYRTRADEIEFMEINSITRRLLEILEEQPGITGKQLLDQIADEMQHPNPQIVIDGGKETLAQLRDEDIILGTWE